MWRIVGLRSGVIGWQRCWGGYSATEYPVTHQDSLEASFSSILQYASRVRLRYTAGQYLDTLSKWQRCWINILTRS
jgi:hypothetical protein